MEMSSGARDAVRKLDDSQIIRYSFDYKGRHGQIDVALCDINVRRGEGARQALELRSDPGLSVIPASSNVVYIKLRDFGDD